MYTNTKKSQLQETIAEEVKLMPPKKKKIIWKSKNLKAENNSYKLKNSIRQIVYLLNQHNKITTII